MRECALSTGGTPYRPLDVPGLAQLRQACGGGDARITAAVLDGPVDLTHPAFQGVTIRSIRTLAGQGPSDNLPTEHGTHVAGILFGADNGPTPGIVPGCKGLSLNIFRVLEGGGIQPCSQVDLARAIISAVDAGAHIINVSGGQFAKTKRPSPFLENAILHCSRNNVLVVAAAGNDGCDCLHFPAAVPTVLAVGAMDADNVPLCNSNWGDVYREQGILAPGKNIVGPSTGGRIRTATGTSFAGPIVAGVAALLMSLQVKHGHEVSAARIREAILETALRCDPSEGNNCDRHLVGILDVAAAARLLFPEESVTASEREEGVSELIVSPDKPRESSETPVPEIPPTPATEGPETPTKPPESNFALVEPMEMSNDPIEEDDPVHNSPEIAEACDNSMEGPGPVPAPDETSAEPEVSTQDAEPILVSDEASEQPEVSMEDPEPVLASVEHAEDSMEIPEPVTAVLGATGPPDVSIEEPETVLASAEPSPSDREDRELILTSAESSEKAEGPRVSVAPSQEQALPYPVYALGMLQIDFSSLTRREAFMQKMGHNPEDIPRLLAHLQQYPWEAEAMTWLLTQNNAPLYAIRPAGPFVGEIYFHLRNYLGVQLERPEALTALPGICFGTHILETGQAVPVLYPLIHAIRQWRLSQTDAGFSAFMHRIAFEFRNLGKTNQERAMNFIVTLGLGDLELFSEAFNNSLELLQVHVAHSRTTQPPERYVDVKLVFFNPRRRMTQASHIYLFTVDISDYVPVLRGSPRSYRAYL
ncbi:MAG: PatA/PatG family cyanobactin maturation protease [Acidobacteriota bacterium]|nr:PatA/PatG family cyanobactin maturation protease [Acidobacteriota bacterium]